MSQIKKRNKSFELVVCEECNLDTAVIIHEKIYYCVECYIFLVDMPWDNAVTNIYENGFNSKIKN
jgi:protein-arginine kinase activator protein McsA